ncbi:hypothetical protein BO94DRAFT_527696 [Aspergillus sclerotioniger CBS 115572]|uniref:GCN5-related N-acetyltransferase Rv2170-like domain-containing protein n=1 Tax=Aspergillus sclerotioniger CBS 115572 TaxID=1450535 RepID=A0A317V6T1_9EURO|nr:hypothetical protein BO94DRAFT_527696 [Aspergillus sclerotioniger CBS 115572]PWY68542.1 hypothetical protein BO94DRAFT_527696 [Aspergillus sclerotioniger CBS 115572]
MCPHPTYQTSPHSSRTQTELLPLLKSHLPHSLPLLRRIQHEIAHPSPTAAILTTFPGPASLVVPELAPVPGPRVPDHDVSPWLIAYVDLSAGRETQIVLYSNLERASFHTNTNTNTKNSPANSTPIPIPISTLSQSTSPSKDLLLPLRTQFLSLLKYIKTHLLPPYLSTIPSPPAKDDHQLAPPPPTAFLIGNLHTGIFSSLLNPGTNYPDADLQTGFVDGVKVHRYDRAPYVKYIIPRERISAKGTGEEMNGFHFGTGNVKRSDLGLVRARTVIPRSEETLAKLRSCAVYRNLPLNPDEEDKPVAWAFLGTDGSLATLHVEEEVRGLGLAGFVGREVMRRGLKDEDEDEGWVHANVAMENRASRRVMEKLGGEVGWTVTWTVLEV